MAGKDFLNGLLWGSLAGGASKNAVDSAKRGEARANLMVHSLDNEANELASAKKHYQRNAYVQTTKLEARIETEKELLIQLADAGLSNDSRIPLANIKRFDEAYLINLVKKTKDQAILEDRYPNGIPSDIENENRIFIRDKEAELKEQGYDLEKLGIKV